MRKFSQYAGKPVIDCKTGSLIGKCEMLIPSSGTKKVSSIKIKPAGLFKRPIYIDASSVKVYGDVSIIMDSGSVKIVEKTPSPIDASVYDTSGRLLGYVSDYVFDEKDGAICQLIVRHGLFEDLAYGRSGYSDFALTELRGESAYITEYNRLKEVTL
ncbi:MAG TPA: PRC-barrel domain-containing protein [Clostridia bacterium]|nr:PRC-barrel domain-containing protein [Clostridia bacterium]